MKTKLILGLAALGLGLLVLAGCHIAKGPVYIGSFPTVPTTNTNKP